MWFSWFLHEEVKTTTTTALPPLPVFEPMTLGETLLPFVSVAAISSTVALFLCGFPIIQRIRSRGSTEGTGPAPFLIGFVSCCFWLEYGLVREDSTSTYLAYYYYMTRAKRRLNQIITFELFCIFSMLYYVNLLGLSRSVVESHLGIVCIVLNIATIGAPMFEIGEVIRSKSSESLPLPLCVVSFVQTVLWLTYGIIVEDMVIQVPNYFALVISVVQLALFVIYPSAPKKYNRLNTTDFNI
ncbi:unnamed protein product [Caenorhabditis auriculariae]|uniref:Sugar transporter SWEET n=1 Tax=Caenorhabditis auriculariae TaxID=2777116 RepID=A0A8S1HJT2_9PELO|nr:unnamed protein product [Caenorhabditis auriculariae]